MTNVNDLQILERTIDTYGVHLTVKNKVTGSIHLEGHDLTKAEMGNKPLLRETPSYFFPQT